MRLRGVVRTALGYAVVGFIGPLATGHWFPRTDDYDFWGGLTWVMCPYCILPGNPYDPMDAYETALMNAVIWGVMGAAGSIIAAKYPRVLWALFLLPGAWAATVGTWLLQDGHMVGELFVVLGVLAPFLPALSRAFGRTWGQLKAQYRK